MMARGLRLFRPCHRREVFIVMSINLEEKNCSQRVVKWCMVQYIKDASRCQSRQHLCELSNAPLAGIC